MLPGALFADDAETNTDIRQAITEGNRAYEAGELSQAAAQFDYVATLLRQLQAGELGTLFPEPLAGWQAENVDTQAGSAAFFGGGINASRRYHKEGASLDISITKDSPLLQTMAVLFTNPSMAAMGGYRMKRIKGQTAMVKEEGNSRELQMLIANRILLQLSGRGITEEDLNAYAEALDMDALTRL
ncbi:hypothetical protein BFR47_08350 [Oceanisphaera psychrotolerans]|uniref:Uncharacterized protein n=1 Tax=Oceanisphaera psychrotolerans TaxID=1414654 RepID=A0A1J4QJL9_9GAMM|nr:hypothetical protein BFR47_08350 [Oceanisphaera psychrotolerans]